MQIEKDQKFSPYVWTVMVRSDNSLWLLLGSRNS